MAEGRNSRHGWENTAPGNGRENQNSPIQPLSSGDEAPVCLSRIPVLLVSGSAGNATGQAPHGEKETAGRLSANQGLDQGQPPFARTAIHQGTESATARALQLLRTPR